MAATPASGQIPAEVTRGTTNPNRLRRADRWLLRTRPGVLLGATRPVVVDIGYGRDPVTVVELAARVRRLRPDVAVVGVELDPQRVAAARARAGHLPGLSFQVGGFGPEPGDRPATVVRAFNVLRQYPVGAVPAAWAAMRARLARGGLVLEGTCDEVGRLGSWVVLDARGPRSLVLSWRLAGLPRPGVVAARLVKVLIERNQPPHAIHRLLGDLDDEWHRAASLQAFGARQRFVAACRGVQHRGWPTISPRQWPDGTLEVAWESLSHSPG